MNKHFSRLIILVLVIGFSFVGSYIQGQVLQVQANPTDNVVVTPNSISFSTVFPQEKLLSGNITLTGSTTFNNDANLNHVYYTLYQFPQTKSDPSETIEVGLPYFFSGTRQNFCRTNIPASNSLSDPYYQNCKPILCQLLSKQKSDIDDPAEIGGDENVPLALRDPNLDFELSSPHSLFAPPAQGHFGKIAPDFVDFWQFDLVVPCFEGQCAQDYSFAEFGPPLPDEFKGQEFGCDVEILVTDVTQNKK